MKNKKKAAIMTLLAGAVVLAVGAAALLRYSGTVRDFWKAAPDLGEREIIAQTETVRVLCCGVDESQKLTDLIMYVQFSPREGSVKVLSIPRDTFVGGSYPTGKINAVYQTTESMDRLAQEIQERFLLPVDYCAAVTLGTFGKIVDQIGGVDIVLEEDLYDLGLKLFSAGAQTLHGDQAQLYVRQRHAYVDADLGRIHAQHQFLMDMMRKVQSLDKNQVLQLVTQNVSGIQTDLPMNQALSIAMAAFTVQPENIEMFTVPGYGKMHGSYAVYEVDCAALAEILNAHFLEHPVQAGALGFPLANGS